jgi:hypothetical protein
VAEQSATFLFPRNNILSIKPREKNMLWGLIFRLFWRRV